MGRRTIRLKITWNIFPCSVKQAATKYRTADGIRTKHNRPSKKLLVVIHSVIIKTWVSIFLLLLQEERGI